MNLSFLVAPETIPPIVVDRRNPDQKKHSTIITICFQNLEGECEKNHKSTTQPTTVTKS